MTLLNVVGDYVVNGLNQYTNVAGKTFSYDNNSNLTSDGSTTFAYDIENRLTSATGAKNATLKYDPKGRLYEVSSAGAITQFLYDGDALVAEYNASGTLLNRYVHGSRVDEPYLWYEGSSVGAASRRNLYTDYQASVIAVTDSAASVKRVNTYDVYGIPGAGNLGRFSYTGQIYLSELGLHYYKARMYSPALGRFLQTDPIGYKDDMDLYSYVGNDPLNKTDPSGLSGCDKYSWCTSIDYGAQYNRRSSNENAVYAQTQIQLAKETAIETGEIALGASVVALPELAVARVAAIGVRAEQSAYAINSANTAINKTGLSRAARAWEKHSGRPGGTFSPLRGNVTEKNATADKFVRSVLESPETVQKPLSGGAMEYRVVEGGQGFRVEANGNFNFIDPYR